MNTFTQADLDHLLSNPLKTPPRNVSHSPVTTESMFIPTPLVSNPNPDPPLPFFDVDAFLAHSFSSSPAPNPINTYIAEIDNDPFCSSNKNDNDLLGSLVDNFIISDKILPPVENPSSSDLTLLSFLEKPLSPQNISLPITETMVNSSPEVNLSPLYFKYLYLLKILHYHCPTIRKIPQLLQMDHPTNQSQILAPR